MKFNILFVAMLSFMAFGVLSSCNKDKNNDTGTAQLWLHLHTNIDTTEAELGEVIANPVDSADPHVAFRNMTIDSAMYTVSNIRLVTLSGDTERVSGSYQISADEEEYEIGSIPTGTFVSVTFDVSNFHVMGMVDTSVAGTGTPNTMYHFMETGTTVTVRMPAHATAISGGENYVVSKDEVFFIHMICDYSKLLRGIDMKTVQTTSQAVSSQMVYNLTNNQVFTYEE